MGVMSFIFYEGKICDRGIGCIHSGWYWRMLIQEDYTPSRELVIVGIDPTMKILEETRSG